MQVSVQNVLIHRDSMTKIGKQLRAWEVPVLEAKFGEGLVERMDGEGTHEVEQLPNAAAEFHRLMRAYGSDTGNGGTNLPCVELAYGRGRQGVAALEKAMNESVVGAKRKYERKKVAVETPAIIDNDEGEGDPLA